MSHKITVFKTTDEDDRDQYIISAHSLAALASLLDVSEDQFVVKEDDNLTRRRRLQELNRRMNSPEAIRQRTDFNPWIGRPTVEDGKPEQVSRASRILSTRPLHKYRKL